MVRRGPNSKHFQAALDEAASGTGTIIYDRFGKPSLMFEIPRFNLNEVIDGAPNLPHPAFIVNGKVKPAIYISMWQNIVHGDAAYSLPGCEPTTGIDFDEAYELCLDKGYGWHLLTNAEWAALALWELKHGRTAVQRDWWEWVDGLKLVNGRIYVHKDNNFMTGNKAGDVTDWQDTGIYFDAEDHVNPRDDFGCKPILSNKIINQMNPSDPNSDDYLAYASCPFRELKAAEGIEIPALLQYLAIAPLPSYSGPEYIWVRNYGERLPIRGGRWGYGARAGVFALYLNYPRSYADARLGFRAAYVG